MAKTRESSHQTHLNWLMRLAITVISPLASANSCESAQRVTESLALARQIAERYTGDHTAWIQVRANVMDALAYMGRITAIHNDFTQVEDSFVQARELCRSYLVSLTHSQRVQLAAYDGFRNPHLTEESHEEGRDPALVIVLTPVYAPETPAKQRVQNKADERFVERYPALALAEALFDGSVVVIAA
ncbi:hypothetical protein ACIBKY_03460 [Nonomuraea sp. NPDC050394]|uniref:hypothetical protein n=1 Tax=Nonomuraea sp. NPDC050394 TaxID=3364363 RepID=UPI0037B4CE9F